MRVLIVSDTFAPDINGVARTLRQLALGLIARGHQVDVVTTSEGAENLQPPEPFWRQVIPSVAVPGYTALRLGLVSPRWFGTLFERRRTDVLYVAVETPMGVAAIAAARWARIGVVSGFHTNFHTYLHDYHLNAFRPAVEAFLRAVHNNTARTLAPSRQTAQMLSEMGLSSVGVLGRGVDTNLFTPTARDPELRRSWGVDDHTPVALHVGRLAAEKNLELLEKAFATFQEAQPHGRCVVVGDGPCAEGLRAAHPRWIFAGMRSGADLARHYASGDLFLFPSMSETFGNVLLEAMASRLLTVSYDYAAANEHMHTGADSFLAPLGDEPAFLNAVRLAAAHWDDAAMRDRAHAHALTLGWEATIAQFEHELRQAIPLAPALSPPLESPALS